MCNNYFFFHQNPQCVDPFALNKENFSLFYPSYRQLESKDDSDITFLNKILM